MKTILLGILLTLSPFTVKAEELQFPKLTGRVVDTANQIPDDQEKILDSEIRVFEKNTHHQFVVVTIPDLKGQDIKDYTRRLGDHWGIGNKELDDGIILLQSPGNGQPGSGKIRIEVGGGMEYILTDVETSRIIRGDMIPVLKQDKPREETTPEAILAGARAIMKLGAITPEQLAENARVERERAAKSWASFKDFMMTAFSFMVAIVFGLLVWFMATAKKRRLRAEQEAADEVKRRQERIAQKRLQEEEDIRQSNLRIERVKQAALDRKNRLSAMSPDERARFCAREEAVKNQNMLASMVANQKATREKKERENKKTTQVPIFNNDYNRRSQNTFEDGPPRQAHPSDDSYSGDGGSFSGGGSDDSY